MGRVLEVLQSLHLPRLWRIFLGKPYSRGGVYGIKLKILAQYQQMGHAETSYVPVSRSLGNPAVY